MQFQQCIVLWDGEQTVLHLPLEIPNFIHSVNLLKKKNYASLSLQRKTWPLSGSKHVATSCMLDCHNKVPRGNTLKMLKTCSHSPASQTGVECVYCWHSPGRNKSWEARKSLRQLSWPSSIIFRNNRLIHQSTVGTNTQRLQGGLCRAISLTLRHPPCLSLSMNDRYCSACVRMCVSAVKPTTAH